MRATGCLIAVVVCLGGVVCAPAWGVDRSIDGTGNNLLNSDQGAAHQPLIRINYPAVYPNPAPGMLGGDVMLTDAQRTNPRDISNAVVQQTGNMPSSRGLSDFIWGWGQFLDHDLGYTSQSAGAGVNGTAPIAVNDPGDLLFPGPIPFTRSNYTSGDCDDSPGGNACRQQVNEITSYVDASNVYGSDMSRAMALRTDGGIGARLMMSSGDLLQLNSALLENENRGPLPAEQLFLAGDIRSNENVLLSSLHTVFAREHNRLVDTIETQQPGLSDEQMYQLARKIVGAEMQIVTYNEFLPALLGPSAPAAADYSYDENVDASITQSFAHAIYRWGHSTVSPQLQFVNDNGTSAGSLNLQYAFSNPAVLTDDPAKVDQLLRGAATQVSQELDVYLIEELRSLLFGPPGSGAGGLDLASINIQRGRDHGLPDFNSLSQFYLGGAGKYDSIAEISSDPTVQANLAAAYNHVLNMDAWVGALAEDHLPDSSAGRLITTIMADQFRRLRDGDRLFYLSDEAGLYFDGELLPEIASIVDLDTITLRDILLVNTSLANLQANVFFAETLGVAGDYNNDGFVTAADYIVWRNTLGSTTDLRANGAATGGSGTLIDEADYLVWRDAFVGAHSDGAVVGVVPEPAAVVLVVLCFAAGVGRRSCRD